jgi:hypothetical protein
MLKAYSGNNFLVRYVFVVITAVHAEGIRRELG